MGLILIGFVLREMQSVFVPFAIAYFLYFLFAPLNDWLYDRKVPLVLIILLDIIIIVFLGIGITRILLESIFQFANDLDAYFSKLNQVVRQFSASVGIKDPYFKSFSIQKIIARIDYKELAGGAFNSVFSLVGAGLLILFFFAFITGGHHAVYIAFKRWYTPDSEEEEITRSRNYLTQELITEENEKENNPPVIHKSRSEVELESTVKAISQQIQKYIITKIALNLLAGIAVGMLMWPLDVDFPVIWGIFTFFLNFIPTIGSAIALILPALMALIQHETIGYALLVASVMALVQTLFFNVFEPMVIGKRLNINPIVILLSVLIWGYIWGIVGMLLAVPLTAIIKIIISNSKNRNIRLFVDLMSQD